MLTAKQSEPYSPLREGTAAGPMPIIFLGPPAAGKGTEARSLGTALRFPSISTGELLRHESHLSSEINRRMQQGKLIPDALINAMVADRIRRSDCNAGFILDGYPRDINQAQYLAFVLHSLNAQLPVVVHILLPDDLVRCRTAARMECPVCGYTSSVPTVCSAPLLCPNDGLSLVHRSDDNDNSLAARLRAYHENIPHLLRFYAGERLFELPGWDDPVRIERSVLQFVRDPAYPV